MTKTQSLTARLALGALLAAAATASAEAHAALWKADPTVNGAATGQVSRLHLIFTEPVSGKLSGVAITDAAGAKIAASPSAIDPADPKAIVATLPTPLKPGAYKVSWHAVASDDGHRSSGAYRFTIK